MKTESIKDGKQHQNNKNVLPVHYKVWWKNKGAILSKKKPVWRQSEGLKKTSVDHDQKG